MALSSSEAAAEARSELARHAIETRWKKYQDPAERRRQTEAGRRAGCVNSIVEHWPELTEAQQARLRALLRPVPEAGEGDA